MVQAQSPSVKTARATLRETLPPKFNGLIAVYPQTIFKPRTFETKAADGASMFVDGRKLPLDGKSYRLSECDARSLSIGSFIAVHVVNERDEPTPVEIVARGISVDVGGEIAPGARLGRVLIPIEEPEGEPPAEGSTEDVGSDDSDDSGPPRVDATDLARSALQTAIGAAISHFVAPMLIDLFAPEEPEEPEAPASEEIYVTELVGVGQVPPPPGNGWQSSYSYHTSTGATRTIWHRSSKPRCRHHGHTSHA